MFSSPPSTSQNRQETSNPRKEKTKTCRLPSDWPNRWSRLVSSGNIGTNATYICYVSVPSLLIRLFQICFIGHFGSGRWHKCCFRHTQKQPCKTRDPPNGPNQPPPQHREGKRLQTNILLPLEICSAPCLNPWIAAHTEKNHSHVQLLLSVALAFQKVSLLFVSKLVVWEEKEKLEEGMGRMNHFTLFVVYWKLREKTR